MLFDYFADLNWLAILVAALAYYALGAIWYSNALFGKQYRAAIGVTEQGRPAAMPLIVNFIGWLIAAVALGLFAAATGASTVTDGVVLGLVAGIGLVVTHQVVGYLFEGRPALIGLSVPYAILGFIVMGVIVTVWD